MLITGSGTLAKAIVKILPKNQRCVIFSRSEYNQSAMKTQYPEGGAGGLRYMLGNVRDLPRLVRAMQGVKMVIHTAAMKRVDDCEYNPDECIKTNIIGSQNVIEACNIAGVNQCVFVSTDKAVSPLTMYGASKMLAERAFIAGNNIGQCRFSVVRYGNVIGSRGSVFERWKSQKKAGQQITITHAEMTRFFWLPEEAAYFILDTFPEMNGGEIFIPKMQAYKMIDLARQFSENIKVTGLRGYEKIHENLTIPEESSRCFDLGRRYVIYGNTPNKPKGEQMAEPFELSSRVAVKDNTNGNNGRIPEILTDV